MSAPINHASPRSARPAAYAVLSRELASYFSSPVAYIVSALFLIFSGFLFVSTFFLVDRAELRDFFGLLPVLFSFIIPALTMRLFAEEKRSGTIETLFTMPVSAFDAVMGKFIASLVFVAVMLVPTLAYVLTAALLGSLDPGPVVGGYLGALFLAASFSSIGLYASAVTKNQIVAFFVAFTICILLALGDRFLVLLPGTIVGVLDFFSAGHHFDAIARGIVDSRDILYFASLAVLFLWMSVDALDERRAA